VALVSELRESFFTSSHWLNACELTWAGRCEYEKFEIYDLSESLGSVLLGSGVECRHSILKSRVMAINETTNPSFDEVTIEFNGFFGGNSSDFVRTFETFLSHLMQRQSWDELRFSGLLALNAASAEEVAQKYGLRTRVFRCRPSYSVDLSRIRDRFNSDYLAALSPNTRQQLRRSLRSIESNLGKIRLEKASCKDQALQWLRYIAPLHRARWPSGKAPTGFDNLNFVRFHETLLSIGFDGGDIDLLRLSVGDQPIAYLYNLKHKGHVGFYLSGIDYGLAEKYRPGMILHWLAIEHYMLEGAEVYDFLAGHSQYKDRLATDRNSMIDLIFWRPRLKLKIENMFRKGKIYLHRARNVEKHYLAD
jgi:hypothetical protein